MKLGEGEHRDGIGRLYTYVSFDELVGMLEAAGFCVDSHVCGESLGLDGTEAAWVKVMTHRS